MGKINLMAIVAMIVLVSGCGRMGEDMDGDGVIDSSSTSGSTTGTGSSTGGSGTGTGTGVDDINAKIVFSREVAPIVMKNCAGCHRSQGGIAPFPLETYSDYYKHRSAIKKSVANRTMPPPGVDNSGSCQNFHDVGWLPQKDLDTIVEWVDLGAPRGDANFRPTLPTADTGLPAPKSVLRMKEPYTPAPPAGKLDDYRCFIVDPKMGVNTMMTGVEIIPDQAKIVHHVIVFKPASPEAQATAEAMDGKDGRPGYPCFGAAGVPSSVVGLWAPGSKAAELKDPETGGKLGLALEANRKLIIQVHYNIANGSPADQSAIAIKTDPTAKPVKWAVLANFQLDLQPGQPQVVAEMTQMNQAFLTIDHLYESGTVDGVIAGTGLELSWDLILAAVGTPLLRDMKAYAVGPHMHQLGRSLKVEKIDASDKTSCMANVPKFDFNWQTGYMFKKSLDIKTTDSLKITCTFDTRGRTTPVKFAEGTEDEMCLAFLLVTTE